MSSKRKGGFTPVKNDSASQLIDSSAGFQKPFQTPRKAKPVVVEEPEELPPTQPLVDVGFSDSLESGSEDFDPEGDFRELVADAIRAHGLENIRAWFVVECRKFKKPKLEKSK